MPATIWDKDILIYLASNLRQALDDGRPVNGTVAVTAADLLAAIRRGSGGKDYRELERALDRLVGTRFKTNLPTANLVEKTCGSSTAIAKRPHQMRSQFVPILAEHL